MEYVLETNNLEKKYKDFRALNHTNVHIEKGAIYGLIGKNGAGKTTFMRMLCTLMRPTHGKITCNGKEIFTMDGDYRKILGYLPQDFGFYPDFTVQDYLLILHQLKQYVPQLPKESKGTS